MNFALNDEQADVKALVERYVADNYDASRRRVYQKTPTGFSATNWDRLANTGVLALHFGIPDGGLGGGLVELITVMEVLGRGLVVEPMLSDIIIAGGLLALAGTAEQKAELLPALMSGRVRIVLAHSEPQARYEMCSISALARTSAGETRVNGRKTMVHSPIGADYIIVSARDDMRDGPSDQVSFYLIRADSPGIDIRPYRLVDDSLVADILLQSVPAIGRLQGGLSQLVDVFDRARLAICAELVGVMSLLVDETLAHLRTRKQFGVSIGSFQAIQHRMADVYVALEQSRSHLFGAVLALDSGQNGAARIAGAKSYISTSALKVGAECIQFHGGMGVSDDVLIGHAYKRAVLLARWLGDSDTELDRYIDLTEARNPLERALLFHQGPHADLTTY